MKEEIKKEIIELLSDKKAREAIDIIKSLGYSQELDSLIMETIQEMTITKMQKKLLPLPKKSMKILFL